MNKKILAIVMELIPVISVPVAIGLIASPLDSPAVRKIIAVTIFLGFLGIPAFLIGRLLAKGDRTVKILGVLDILATVAVIGYYILAICLFGL